MRIIKRTGFFVKMMLALTVVLILLGATSIVQTRFMMNDLFKEQQEKRGISIANTLALRAANLILVNNYYDLHELVKDTQRTNDDVRYVFVVNNQGELLAHSFPAGFPKGLLQANTLASNEQYKIVELATEEGLVRDIAVPILEGRLGIVHVGLNDASLQNVLNRTIRQIMLDMVIAVLIGIMATMFLTRRLVKPIQELVHVTSAITRGDLTQRAKATSDDEVGKLAVAFNAMADYLQQTMDELKQKEEARTHLLQKVIVAQEEERKRIARELHDETGQTLASLMMGLKCLAATCPESERGCRLEEMRLAVKKTIDAVHRMAIELRPSILDDMGLIPAVEKYVNDFRHNYGIDTDLHIQWQCEKRLVHEIEVTVYRIVQEALTNIAKYAKADNVCIIMTCDRRGLEVIVEDDGVGFDADAILQQSVAGTQLGLFGMQERATLVGGALTIESTPGRGTTLFLRIPFMEGRPV
ncbi:sensor histidine kinase [Sporolituus thermophilus]|uniref:Oxygen sensor histidine kinase NreB n=1 Tax=Sporolituus thermophilus DSM 23256 TaxID=1123285 RepID=A0A1G7HQW3_9FIRM|nr:HAMP domain-containing protein [Sporolituus thermophilus]SDF02812.1 Histidine kinase-, DNA gyrase B-, and HSP90-like ATPase [Sporolituus thermophilus DSM 23256]